MPASGTGAVDVTVASLAAGDSVTIELATTVSAQPPASLVNTASLAVGEANAQCTGSTAQPCIASATVATTNPPVPPPPPPVPTSVEPVPSLQQWSLVLLTLLTGGLGAWRMRSRGQRIG